MARVNVTQSMHYIQRQIYEKTVEKFLKAPGEDLSNGGGFEELEEFQEYLSDYKIVVFDGLNSMRVLFSENSLSDKKLYLLHNAGTMHYNVITNLEGAMAKSACVTRVTLYMTFHTNVTKLAPCVQLRHPVLKIRPSIVVHVIGGFPVRNAFRTI